MMTRVSAAFILLVGCSASVDVEAVTTDVPEEGAEDATEGGAAPVVIEQCDAEDYRPLIGTPVAGAAIEEDVMLRIYAENDIITQEYLPRRTNVVHDTRGVVRDVYCG